jgi:acetyl esterase
VAGLILRGLMRLPPRLQVRLSRRPPVRHGDDVLHPQMQLLLALAARWARPAPAAPVERRADFRRSQRAIDGRKVGVARVRSLTVPGPAGGLSARHYDPGGGGRPLLVFYHGGGFAVGDLDTHDGPCRLLCRALDAHVLSVEYRLAPEHPFPAAVEDADAAFAWAAAHAGEFGADPARLGVGGDSAGGNLAAVVSLLRAKGPARPGVQLLLYPATDRVRDHRYPSLAAFADGFLLTAADIARYTEWYARGHDLTDPRMSPIHAKDLSGLPPAVVATAAFDPLCDEGEAYAAALAAAGTPVRKLRFPLIHGFANLTGVSPACRRATAEAAAAAREFWEAGR